MMDTKIQSNEMVSYCLSPRHMGGGHIKLLRLSMVCDAHTPCDDVGIEWNPSLPEDSLSPVQAARRLGVDVWSPISVINNRYASLQKRYPVEQFMEHHTLWSPAHKLLGKSRERLNWFWKTGLIPHFGLKTPSTLDNLHAISHFLFYGTVLGHVSEHLYDTK